MALREPRRYGYLLLFIALVLLIHSIQTHKEYRFVFAVIPLWLLVGAGVITRLASRTGNPVRLYGAIGALFIMVSLAGILNALPYQQEIYKNETTLAKQMVARFIRGQNPVFAAYRYLSRTPGVTAVWQHDSHYYNLPGYYYLHRKIPFYDFKTGLENNLPEDPRKLQTLVSHVVTTDPNLFIPGYALEKEFANLKILRRERNESPARQWQNFTPIINNDGINRIIFRMKRKFPYPPPNSGIHLIASE